MGSRKAVFDEWKSGKSFAMLAKLFNLTQARIKDFLIEYQLYLESIKIQWPKEQKSTLLDPGVEFNPPVRFLQGKGHMEMTGIAYDRVNIKVLFQNAEAKKKFRHLIFKLVIDIEDKRKATDSYDVVFQDFDLGGKSDSGGSTEDPATGEHDSKSKSSSTKETKKKPTALFGYASSTNNALIEQLMKEARDINCKKFPAAATFLLRNIIEAILKHIIDLHNVKQNKGMPSLGKNLDLCLSNHVGISKDDKKILSEFKNSHLNYLNLGAHANVIPNVDRLSSARDCIDQFVKKHA